MDARPIAHTNHQIKSRSSAFNVAWVHLSFPELVCRERGEVDDTINKLFASPSIWSSSYHLSSVCLSRLVNSENSKILAHLCATMWEMKGKSTDDDDICSSRWRLFVERRKLVATHNIFEAPYEKVKSTRTLSCKQREKKSRLMCLCVVWWATQLCAGHKLHDAWADDKMASQIKLNTMPGVRPHLITAFYNVPKSGRSWLSAGFWWWSGEKREERE